MGQGVFILGWVMHWARRVIVIRHLSFFVLLLFLLLLLFLFLFSCSLPITISDLIWPSRLLRWRGWGWMHTKEAGYSPFLTCLARGCCFRTCDGYPGVSRHGSSGGGICSWQWGPWKWWLPCLRWGKNDSCLVSSAYFFCGTSPWIW